MGVALSSVFCIDLYRDLPPSYTETGSMEAAEHSLFTRKALLTHGGNSDTGGGYVSMPKAPLVREKRARSTIDLVTLGFGTLPIIYEVGYSLGDSIRQTQSIPNYGYRKLEWLKNRNIRTAFLQLIRTILLLSSINNQTPNITSYLTERMHPAGLPNGPDICEGFAKTRSETRKVIRIFFCIPSGNRSIFLRMLKSFQTKFNRLTSLKMRVGSQTSKVKLAD